MKVIGSFVRPYVRKVLACMNLLRLDYQVDPITPFFGNEEFERLSPLRRIPVLIDGDLTVTDSSVICTYLEEQYGGYPLLPRAPKDRALARWFEEYADTRLGDLFIWSLFYQKIVRPTVWGEGPDKERVAETLEKALPRELDYLETQVPGAGFLFGDIGVADIAIATFFRNGAYAGFEPDPGRWPKVTAYVARVLGHECIARLLPFEDIQRSSDIRHRRQALLDAGAPLTEQTLGLREPRRGVMTL